jgi:hypothetical protein
VSAADGQLTAWEQALRAAAALLGVISLGFAVAYLVKGIEGPAEFPFATNSVAKDVLLAALAFLIVRDVRRWAVVAVPLIVLAHLIMPVVMALTALLDGPDGMAHTWNGPPDSASALRLTWSAADLAVAALFVWLYRKSAPGRG